MYLTIRAGFCLVLCLTMITAQEVLDNSAVLKLVKAGMSEEVILGMMNSQPGKYDTSTDGVIAMKSAGVSDKIIAAMVNKATPVATSMPPSAAVQSNSSSG